MKKVLVTGGSKGLGAEIKKKLIDYEVIDWSRSTGVDLTEGFPSYECDVLICNAGVWDNDWALNFEVPQAMAERMPKDKHVIFILSTAAYKSFGNDGYTAAKSGLLHYARRKQDAGYKFTTISPGAMNCDNFWKDVPVDNRKRGCIEPEVVAELVYQAIIANEKGGLIREMIITPEVKDVK